MQLYYSPDGYVYGGERKGRIINGQWVWDKEIPEPPETEGYKWDNTQQQWVKDIDYLLLSLQEKYEPLFDDLKSQYNQQILINNTTEQEQIQQEYQELFNQYQQEREQILNG